MSDILIATQTMIHGSPQKAVELVAARDADGNWRNLIRVRNLGQNAFEIPAFASDPCYSFAKVHLVPDSNHVIFLRRRIEENRGLNFDGLFTLDLASKQLEPRQIPVKLDDRWWISELIHVKDSKVAFCTVGQAPDPWLGGMANYYFASLDLEEGNLKIQDQFENIWY